MKQFTSPGKKLCTVYTCYQLDVNIHTNAGKIEVIFFFRLRPRDTQLRANIVWIKSSDTGHKASFPPSLPSCVSNNELRYNRWTIFLHPVTGSHQFQDDVRPDIDDRESGLAPGVRA